MSYRKKKALNHIQLPLIGSNLSQVITDSLITLQFLDKQGFTAQLVLEQSVTIYPLDAPSIKVVSTKPGATFDASAIEPITKLVGKQVKQAIASHQGSLHIEFYDGIKLEIVPDVYEAWHFQKPAPRTMMPYPIDFFSLHGSDGELI